MDGMAETQKISWVLEKITEKKQGLDLGCGKWKLPNSIGMDLRSNSSVDLLIDVSDEDFWMKVEHSGFPLKYDFIFSSHLLEDFILEDQIRISKMWIKGLKDDGLFIAYVPQKGAYKGVNLNHKREFERGYIEDLFEILNLETVLLFYENAWKDALYGILGIGRKNNGF